MALQPNLSKGLTITWITEKPFKDRCRVSSDFSLGETTWYLKMESHVDLYSTYKLYYSISLNERAYRDPKKPFTVVTGIVMKCGKRNNPFTDSRALTTVKTKKQSIWKCVMDEISEKIYDFGDYAEMMVVCVFKDLPPSLCRFRNETNDVSIQTDVVWPHTTLQGSNSLPPGEIPPVEKHGEASKDDSGELENLSGDFSKLMDQQRHADLKLTCGERSFSAHRSILAARSEVFAELAQNDSTNVDFPDVDGKILELLLKYVYSGRIPHLTNETAPKLSAAGLKYSVHGLQKLCSEWMTRNLSEENCVSFLACADENGDESFKNTVSSFIISHPEVMKTEGWLRFSEVSLKLANEVYHKFFSGVLGKNELSD